MGSRKGAKIQWIDETGDRKIEEEVGHGRSSKPSPPFIDTARGWIQSLQKTNDEDEDEDED